MPDALTGGLVVGGQVLGGLMQSNAASNAARAQTRASEQELEFLRQIYREQQQQNRPTIEARDVALSQYMAELGLPPIQAAMPGQVQQVAPQAQATQTAQAATQAAPRVQYTHIGHGQYRTSDGRIINEQQYRAESSRQQVAQEVTQQLAQQMPQTTQAPIEYYTPTVTNQLTPADQWQIDESIKAAQIAAGGKLGGREFRAISERAGGLALQNRENRLNRLANLAGTTATLTQNAQNLQQGLGGQMGQAMGNVGAARSSGYINRSNALSGTLQGLSNLGLYSQSNNLFGGGGSLANVALPNNMPPPNLTGYMLP